MMKRLLLSPALSLALAALPLVVTAGHARAAETATATLSFQVAAREGDVMVALFDSEDAYQKNTPVQAARVPVGAGPVRATFQGLKPGRYAAKVFHDLDGDGKMGVNPLGMPTEPFGFSNNAPVRFGPPVWSAAAFEVGSTGAAQTIALR